jgi:hypothetical protein
MNLTAKRLFLLSTGLPLAILGNALFGGTGVWIGIAIPFLFALAFGAVDGWKEGRRRAAR